MSMYIVDSSDIKVVSIKKYQLQFNGIEFII